MRLAGVIVGLVLVVLLGTSSAAAQAPGYDSADGCSGSWQDSFGVKVLILDCAPGYATEHDRAYMFARGPVDVDAPWRSQLDFTNSVWVFDAGARRKASLIVDFHPDGQALVAELYDDTDRDGEVHYGFERGIPRSVESPFPTLTVRAPAGWWVRDGIVNYDLKLTVDGPVLASWGGELFLEWSGVNGHPDAMIDVYGTPGSGRPRWQIVQAQPDGTSDSAAFGFYRTTVMVNESDDEHTPDTYIFWPHLGYAGEVQPSPPPPARTPLRSLAGATYGIVKYYKRAYPPIQVDWAAARVKTVGEFVASRGRHTNWFVNSLLRAGRDGQTVADFENPFAFYDLAGVRDGYPDLQIADAFFPAGDPFTPQGAEENHHLIRFSWDQDHTQAWSYKIGLRGHRPTLGIVDLGEGVRIATVPYRELPTFIVGNSWDTADFVAYERPLWTTEGLYETCGFIIPDNYEVRHRREPTLAEMLPVSNPGSRCEFVRQLGAPPRLYVGPVDRKVHLYGAEVGQWTLPGTMGDGTRVELLRYSAVGGPIVNRWERLSNGVLTESLSHFGDRLIYVDQGGVQIARGPGQAPLLVTQPPTDNASWERLRSQLAIARKPGEGSALGEVFGEHEEEVVRLPGAVMWDIRPEGSGFRAMIELPDPVPDTDLTRSVAPGTYLLVHDPSAGLSLQPAAPPELDLTTPTLRGDAPAVLAPTRVAVRIRNDGRHDVRSAAVAFLAGPVGSAPQLVGSTTVDLPSGKEVIAEMLWLPAAAGEWELRAIVPQAGGAASEPARLSVGTARATDPGSLLLAQGLGPFTVGAMTASLTLVAAIAVGVGFVVWLRGSRLREDGPDR